MLVAIIVVISILSTAVFVRAFSFDSPQNGDIVSFGSYPQSEVKDENLLKELNKLSLSWKSYDYYSGNDVNGDGIGDYGSMNKRTVYKYADLFYEGERYRAVLFSQYRPYVPFGSTSSKATNNYQIENGYFVNNTYFFKYEPLMWRVLDADDGLLLSEKIIDCQPFSNTVYMYGSDDNYAYAFWDNASHTCYYNNYSNSSLRKWLNDNFYNTSFYDYQKYNIKTIHLDNSMYNKKMAIYSSKDTDDNVFLLSFDDLKNKSYSFSETNSEYDPNRRAKGTDYAKCQGLSVYRNENSAYNGCSTWYLRTAGMISNYVCNVRYNGFLAHSFFTEYGNDGIRPAIKLKSLKNLDCNHYIKHNVEKSTCVTNGKEYDYCVLCGNKYDKKILPLSGEHFFGEWKIIKTPTLSQKGIEERKCKYCDKTEQREILSKATGLYKVDGEWRYYKDGKFDPNFSGRVDTQYGRRTIKNGSPSAFFKFMALSDFGLSIMEFFANIF